MTAENEDVYLTFKGRVNNWLKDYMEIFFSMSVN